VRAGGQIKHPLHIRVEPLSIHHQDAPHCPFCRRLRPPRRCRSSELPDRSLLDNIDEFSRLITRSKTSRQVWTGTPRRFPFRSLPRSCPVGRETIYLSQLATHRTVASPRHHPRPVLILRHHPRLVPLDQILFNLILLNLILLNLILLNLILLNPILLTLSMEARASRAALHHQRLVNPSLT